jgi:hypothetical protein
MAYISIFASWWYIYLRIHRSTCFIIHWICYCFLVFYAFSTQSHIYESWIIAWLFQVQIKINGGNPQHFAGIWVKNPEWFKILSRMKFILLYSTLTSRVIQLNEFLIKLLIIYMSKTKLILLIINSNILKVIGVFFLNVQ